MKDKLLSNACSRQYFLRLSQLKHTNTSFGKLVTPSINTNKNNLTNNPFFNMIISRNLWHKHTWSIGDCFYDRCQPLTSVLPADKIDRVQKNIYLWFIINFHKNTAQYRDWQVKFSREVKTELPQIRAKQLNFRMLALTSPQMSWTMINN